MNRKLFFILLLGLLLIFINGCRLSFDLPELEIPQTSTVIDVNGQTIAAIFEENRIPVPIEDVSPYLLKAIIAIEDHRFLQHRGVDLQAIARAFVRNIQAGATVEGGSTITQQTAKVLFLSPERTYSRKIKELLLTFQLERQFTKKEILEKYVNLIFFGHGAYGIEIAAQTYFNKTAKELSLGESAMLAGLVRGPAFYSPFTKPEAARDRQRVVLNRMLELEIITAAEAAAAREEQLVLDAERRRFRQAPYFTAMVIEQVSQMFEDGPELLHRGGLSIHTTLDLNMQRAAEQAFQNGLKNLHEEINGALIALDPNNGHIKALAGGRDFAKNQRNNATLARRQPGSAFKPFLFAAALERGYTAGTTILWEPVIFEIPGSDPWQPSEYDNREYINRSFTLKEALARSLNIIAAKLINDIGPGTVVDYAARIGIESDLRPFLSLALGSEIVTPIELTSAFGVFATNGILADPIFITQILDRKGRVIFENHPNTKIVLDAKTAYIITDMLRGVIESPFGTARQTRNIINRPAAGKTGTTNNLMDAWFVGYTPQLVTGVYLGDDFYKLPVGATGGSAAAPIWANFMAEALRKMPPIDFPEPPGLVRVLVCSDSGLLATPQSPETIEIVFVAGTEPVDPCSVHSNRSTGETPRQWDNWFNRFFN
ncbi:MAG: PBP1A family penicillin-binding protein [Clostridia bacterium]|jgi:1A family penicillin-binding protein|nr:PBP1A family penicillin-binding protein [Clostridia bacterium]